MSKLARFLSLLIFVVFIVSSRICCSNSFVIVGKLMSQLIFSPLCFWFDWKKLGKEVRWGDALPAESKKTNKYILV